MADLSFGPGHSVGGQLQQQFVPAFPTNSMSLARQPLPKQLTAAIKGCTSLDRLAQLHHAHQAVLNPIHIAAMITKLPKLDAAQGSAMGPGTDLPWMLATASSQQVQLRQLLQQLLSQLKLQGCSDHSPRGVANIVWALAKLQYLPDKELRTMLLDAFCSKLSAAVPQDISNVLWGVAKLTKECSAMLASSHSSHMQVSHPPSSFAASMSPGSASSSLQLSSSAISAQEVSSSSGLGTSIHHPVTVVAAAAAPDAPLLQQQQVRLLLQHLSQQLQSASVQTISNSLWAVVVLQQEHQWCMCNCLQEVQTLLTVFSEQPEQALPGHIQPIIRCMAQLATTCHNHAGDSWIRWQPPLLQRLLEYLCSQREHMELHHVSSVLRDVAQAVCLHLLRDRQLKSKQQQLQQQQAGMSIAVTAGGEYSGSDTSILSLGEQQGRGPSPILITTFGSSHNSSAASSSSTLGPSQQQQQQATVLSSDAAAEEEAEEVLSRLAASGGPHDASSTVLALTMLRPYLQQLGLQAGVAGLCCLLPPAALPHLGADVGQQLLAAASSQGRDGVLLPACSPLSPAAASPKDGNTEVAAATAGVAVLLPVSSTFAANLFAQQRERLPVSPVPSAREGSSTSGSGSNITSPTGTYPDGGLLGNVVESFTADTPTAAAGVTHAPLGSDVEGFSSVTANPSSGHPNYRQHDAAAGASSADCPPGSGHCDNTQQSQSLSVLAPSGLLQPLPPASEGSHEPVMKMKVPGDQEQAGSSTGAADSQEEAAARQLTHNIAYADSVFQLADIFTAHASVMDMIHITACITRLSKVLGTSPAPSAQAAAAALLPMLGAKLQAVLPHANARGIANVLWGYGRLRNLPQADLLPPLLEAFLKQLPNAACRDSAVVLWSLARLAEGQGGPEAVGVQPALLCRLGREVLQQLATAAQASTEHGSGNQHHHHQQQQQGVQAGSGGSSSKPQGKPDVPEGPEPSAPPSSRDISNSLMALARLGFMPDDGSSSTQASGTVAAAGPAAEAEAAQHQGAAQAATVAAGLEGLSLGSPQGSAAQQGTTSQQIPAAAAAAAGQDSPARLSLPLECIRAVVTYLLGIAATAKTLDLQETATALKQLGLRELQAAVAAAIVAHHGPAHAGPPHGPAGTHGTAGLHYMHLGGHAASGSNMHMLRPGQLPAMHPGRPGGAGAPGGVNLTGGAQLTQLLHQQRRHQSPVVGAAQPYGSAGWMPAHSAGMTLDPTGLLRRQSGPGGFVGFQQSAPGQLRHMPAPPGGQQQQQQHPYVLSMPAGIGATGAAAGGNRRMGGMSATTLSAAAGAASVMYGGSPGAYEVSASPGAPSYAAQYQGGQQQQQQLMLLPGYQQQQQQQQQQAMLVQAAGGGMQYMLIPRQQQQAAGGYILQPPQQQQQQGVGDLFGMQMLPQMGQQQPGMGAGQQQYFVMPTTSQAVVVPGAAATDSSAATSSWMATPAGGQPQLLLQQAQPAGGPAGLGGLGQFAPGLGPGPSSAAMLGASDVVQGLAMTSAAYAAAPVGGEAFVGQQAAQQQQQQQQQRGPQMQQMLQQMAPGSNLYQPQQPVGLPGQEAGVYLQQQQQQQPLLPMVYGVTGQGQQQQQYGSQQQPGAGSFVMDPTTGMYQFQ